MSVLTWRVLDKHSYLARHFRPTPPETAEARGGGGGGGGQVGFCFDQMKRSGPEAAQVIC